MTDESTKNQTDEPMAGTRIEQTAGGRISPAAKQAILERHVALQAADTARNTAIREIDHLRYVIKSLKQARQNVGSALVTEEDEYLMPMMLKLDEAVGRCRNSVDIIRHQLGLIVAADHRVEQMNVGQASGGREDGRTDLENEMTDLLEDEQADIEDELRRSREYHWRKNRDLHE